MRILIADDHELVRKGVCSVLLDQPGYRICGEAVDGQDALEQACRLHPDVVVMDISMPRLNGLEAARELRRLLPQVSVLILSQHESRQMMKQALDSGAKGYVVKSSISADLIKGIEAIRQGEMFFDRTVLQHPDTNVDVQEILQRSQAFERALRESEERFRLTFERAAVGIANVAEDGRWLRVNRKLCEITGYSEDELQKLKFQGMTHPDDLEGNLAQLRKLASGEVDQLSIEKRYIRKDKTPIWIHLTVGAIRDSERKLKYFISVIEDISRRKGTEMSASLLASIVDSSDDAIISKNLDGTITSWNKGAERIFGYTAEEAIGKNITLIIPDERRKEEVNIIARLRKGERLDHFSTVRVRKDGALLDISLTISPVRNARGEIVGASKVARDVTAERAAERALRQSEERFRAIVDTTPDCVKLIDGNGMILHMNSAGLQMVGASTLAEIAGKSVFEIIAPEDRDRYRQFNERIYQGQKGALEFAIVGLDGVRRYMETHAAPLQGADGSVVHLAVTRDVTPEKQHEKALREQQERFKFVAESSHVGVWFCNLPLDKLIWDERVKEHFWLPPDAESTMETFYARLHPDDRERTRTAIVESTEHGALYDVEYRTVSPDGRHKWIRAVGRTTFNSQGTATRFDGLTFDITATKRAEENYRKLAHRLEEQVLERTLELEKRNAEIMKQSDLLREFSQRLLQIQDEERRRVARELHDSAGQILTALGMELGIVSKSSSELSSEAATAVEQSRALVIQLSQEIRTVSYLLHPPLLDESGLTDALHWYVRGLRSRSKIEIDLEIAENLPRLTPEAELVIFRVVQEGLTNIHRHSESKTARIGIAYGQDVVCVDIEDQGRGIPPQKLAEIQAHGSGVGITGMRERVRQLKGEMSIASNAQGTTVSVRLPLTPAATNGTDVRNFNPGAGVAEFSVEESA